MRTRQPPFPSRRTVSVATAHLEPHPLTEADLDHALLRVWAARLRDGGPADAARLARALWIVLDLLGELRRGGHADAGLDAALRQLLGALRARGQLPPGAPPG